jgi:hypothetical protein
MVFLITEKQLSLLKERVFKEEYYLKISSIINRLDRLFSKLEIVLNNNIEKLKEKHGDEYINKNLSIYNSDENGVYVKVNKMSTEDNYNVYVVVEKPFTHLEGELKFIFRSSLSMNQGAFYTSTTGNPIFEITINNFYLRFDEYSGKYKLNRYHTLYKVLYHELVHYYDYLDNEKYKKELKISKASENYKSYRSSPNEFIAFLNDAFYTFIEYSFDIERRISFKRWMNLKFGDYLDNLDENYRKKAIKAIYAFYTEYENKKFMYRMINKMSNPRIVSGIMKGGKEGLDLSLIVKGMEQLMKGGNSVFVDNWYNENKTVIKKIIEKNTSKSENCDLYKKGGDYNDLMGYSGTENDRDWCQEAKAIYNKIQ